MQLLNSESVEVTTLSPHPENPRRGDVDAIVTSLRVNGQYAPIVARASDRVVLAGNHRLEAVKRLGWGSVLVQWIECDDIEARRILLADNRTSDVARYDGEALASLLEQFADDPAGTGYEPVDIERVLSQFSDDADGAGPDADDIIDRPPPYSLVFEDRTQRTTWQNYLRWLAAKYADRETITERVIAHLFDSVPELKEL